mmetsp:Transcript_2705/g.10430  ORF Transcript_2705/g.10430 Transcript_2705/m.10430 type:complete len:238 (-) Transcript_2705:593-1306(-)
MIDDGVDVAVANRLRDDGFRVLHARQTELLGHVGEGNLGVRSVNTREPGSNDVRAQAVDQVGQLVFGKRRPVRLRRALKRGQVAHAHRLDEIEIRCQGRAHLRLSQLLSLGNLSQKHSNDGDPLQQLETEPLRPRRRFLVRLRQVLLRLAVFQLHGAYATEVVRVTALLLNRSRLRQRHSRSKLFRVVVKVVVQVVAQQQVDQSFLADFVQAQRRRPIQRQKRRARVFERSESLVRE